MGVKTPQELKIQPIQPIPRIQPIQMRPLRPKPLGAEFVSGNQRTMNIPGAPKLPNNPFADKAWWRQMYGPK
jgi:hypothetical protein